MATHPSNPLPSLPDEAEYLAWIEGEPLARDREQAVARALGEDRALARRLEAMRADRAAFKTMPEVAAPAELMGAVEAALQPMLERQMLLGLRDGDALSDHPPISIVQPVKRSIMQAFFADRVGRRLAAAAALLLMVGGVTYLGTTYLSGRTAPTPSTFTRNDARPPAAPEPDRRLALAERNKTAPESPGVLAAVRASAGAAAKIDEPAVTPEAQTPVAIADASEYGVWATGPFLPDLDGARAADLAREGRLVIRVTALDPTARNAGLADRIRHADQSMFRLGDEPMPAMIALLAPPAAAPQPEPAREEVYRPRLTGDSKFQAEDPRQLVGPPPPPPNWNLPPPQTVYLVQTRLDGVALDALKSTLAGGYGEAQYEEQSEPLPQEGSAALNPASVVWWTQGPSGWAWWASVPVVIDTAR